MTYEQMGVVLLVLTLIGVVGACLRQDFPSGWISKVLDNIAKDVK